MLWVAIALVCFAVILTHHIAEWAERKGKVKQKIKRHKRVGIALAIVAVLSLPAEVGLHIADAGQKQQDANNAIKQGNCIMTAADPSKCF